MDEQLKALRVADVIIELKDEIERLESIATEERNRRERLTRERDILRAFLFDLKQRLDDAPPAPFLDAIRAELAAAWIKADQER